MYRYLKISETFKCQNKFTKDKVKTTYCKEMDLKLIRIPYWEMKNSDSILSKGLF